MGFRFTFVRGDCFLKTCPMITDEHTNQFLETYGRAMLSWQAVEFRLLLLFLAIIRAHDQHIASAVYHAVTNINTRIEMIAEGLKVALPESALQQEWTQLRKKIGRHAAKRNLLAHYTVTTHTTWLDYPASCPQRIRYSRQGASWDRLTATRRI